MASIIFDFDGTIIDSYDLIFDIANRYTSKYNLSTLSKKDRKLGRTKTLSEILREDLNVDFHKLPFFISDVKNDYSKEIGKLKTHKGMKSALKNLSTKHHLYLLTSNGKKSAIEALERNKICCFKDIYSDSSLFGKQVVIHRLMKKHKLSRNDTIYVGDETRDIEACRKAGIKIIAVTWGFNTRTLLRKYEPAAIVHTPQALVKAVETLIPPNEKQTKSEKRQRNS